jgi:anthranilate synthase component 2
LIEVEVQRNDAIDFKSLDRFSHIVLSPGPGLPNEANDLLKLIEQCFDKKPLFGVCLGMQALAEFTDATLFNQEMVKHGVAQQIVVTKGPTYLFKDLPSKFDVGLYHSWAVAPNSLSDNWLVTALSNEGVLMAIEHKTLPIAAVQFHPESILTQNGVQVIQNWLNQTKK